MVAEILKRDLEVSDGDNDVVRESLSYNVIITVSQTRFRHLPFNCAVNVSESAASSSVTCHRYNSTTWRQSCESIHLSVTSGRTLDRDVRATSVCQHGVAVASEQNQHFVGDRGVARNLFRGV